MIIDAKKILKLTGIAAASLALLGVIMALTADLAPAFNRRMERKAASAPLLRRAGELGITYETALRTPSDSLGKPVVWCVHLSSGKAFYGHDKSRPIDITNPGEMPSNIYKPQSGDYECSSALLEITAIKTFDYGGARAVRVVTRFIDYL